MLSLLTRNGVKSDLSIAPELGRPVAEASVLASIPARLQAGDIVVNSTGRGTLGRAAHVPNDPVTPLVADGHVTVIRVRPDDADPRFVSYILATDAFYQQANVCLAVGATNQTELNREALRRMAVVLPPTLDEQRRIADYLDAETARIDELIAEQGVLQTLVGEHVDATVNDLVWRSRSETIPLGRLTPADRRIMYGIVLPGPNVPEGVLIVKGGDVKPDRLEPSSLNRTTNEIEAPYRRARLRSTDVVYAIRGSIGDAALVPESLDGANITQDVARISPGPWTNPRWLLYAVTSRRFFAQMEAEARGATIRGINIWSLKRGRVPLVGEPEQRRVAAELDGLSEAGVVRAELAHQIDLLRDAATRSSPWP
ncbi:MAG: restriction endonuclease subunit S [Acidimicrobiales bacterium]